MSAAGAHYPEAYSGCHSFSNSSPVPISFSWVENGTVRVLCLGKKQYTTQYNATQRNVKQCNVRQRNLTFVVQHNTT